jgi:hypothetical protein
VKAQAMSFEFETLSAWLETRVLIRVLMLCSILSFGAARADGFLAAGLGVADAKFSFGGAAMIVLNGSLDEGAIMVNPSLELQAFRFIPVPADALEPSGTVLDVAVGAVYWRGAFLAWHAGLKAHALIDLVDINRTRFAIGVPIGFFLIPYAVQLEPMIDTRGAFMFRAVLYWFFTAI